MAHINTRVYPLFTRILGAFLCLFTLRYFYYDFIHTLYLSQPYHHPYIPNLSIAKHAILLHTTFAIGLISAAAIVYGKKIHLWASVHCLACLAILQSDRLLISDHHILIVSILILLISFPKNTCETIKTRYFKYLFFIVNTLIAISYLHPDWLNGIAFAEIRQDIFHRNPLLYTFFSHNIIEKCCIYLLPLIWGLSPLYLEKWPKHLVLYWSFIATYSYILNGSINGEFHTYTPHLLAILSLCYLKNETIDHYIKTEKMWLNSYLETPKISRPKKQKTIVKVLLSIYIIFQIVYPLSLYLEKHWTWSDRFTVFCWTMKAYSTQSTITYVVVDTQTKQIVQVPKSTLGNKNFHQSYVILKTAHQLKRHYQNKTGRPIQVFVIGHKSMNQSNLYPFTNPNIDIGKETPKYFKKESWILPKR